MDREAFKQRMQSLKSYREQNPGKGYLDWKTSLPDNLQDERSDRHGNDNATVSDTELQGRRDTHKEEEQREIQCPEEENR